VIAGLPLKLLVGLGNPGSQYRHTRHNAGFWFIDELASAYGARFRSEARIQGETAIVDGPGGPVCLIKPMTFMNRSGQAVSVFARYYRLPTAQILVAHDELDFQPGVVRLKLGGGHGGHNGLRDIIAHLGSADFVRLRLGIGHPVDRALTTAYVLANPSTEDARAILEAVRKAVDVMPSLLSGDLSLAMNQLNVR
jgi:PTH1 family peptidyl-tRNA hydrolase